MSDGPPPPPRHRDPTRRLPGWLAVVGVAVAVVVVALVVIDSSGEPRSPDLGGTRPPSVPATTTPPPPSGSVRLVEKGFSVASPHPELDGDAAPVAYVGFIIENTSDQIAISTPISYHYVDGAGDVIEGDYADVDVAALGAGQRFAWGDFDRPLRPALGSPAEVVVEVGQPRQWIAPTSPSSEERSETVVAGVATPLDLEEMARATVDDVALSYDGESALTVTFTVNSGAAADVRATAGLILRSRAGQIVMGWVSPVDLGPATTHAVVEIPTFDQEPGDRGRLAELDPAQTEVYFAVL